MSDEPPPDLAGLAYMFYYVDDPAAFAGLDDAARAALEQQYTPEQILGFYEALEWAVAHPDYNFTSVGMYDAIQWALARPSFGFVAEYQKHIPPEPAMLGDDAAVLDYFKKVEQGMRPLVEKLRRS